MRASRRVVPPPSCFVVGAVRTDAPSRDSPKFLGHILQHDGFLLQVLEPLLLFFHLLVLLEVLDVLGVGQVLQLCVLVVVSVSLVSNGRGAPS